MASVDPGASTAIWRNVVAIAALVRYMLKPAAASRCHQDQPSLAKVERGDPAVSLGIYATVLFVLGFVSRLADMADAREDEVGLQLEEERLPQRIRQRGKTGRSPA
jgi:hypothetical protein